MPFNFTSDPTAAAGGYNPNQYASRETSNRLGEMLGADVYQTRGSGAGSFGYKPQDILFSQGSAQNAGLVANMLQNANGAGDYQLRLRALQEEAARERAGNTSWQNADSALNVDNTFGMFSRPSDGYRAPANQFIDYSRMNNLYPSAPAANAPTASTAVQPGFTPVQVPPAPAPGPTQGGWSLGNLPGVQGGYGQAPMMQPGGAASPAFRQQAEADARQAQMPWTWGQGRAQAPAASGYWQGGGDPVISRPGGMEGGPMGGRQNARPAMSMMLRGMFRQRQPARGGFSGFGMSNPMYSFTQ